MAVSRQSRVYMDSDTDARGARGVSRGVTVAVTL
jgi:hypothetical protein